MGMLKTVSQAWKVAEIRSKMLFTLMMLIIFRIGSNIPVPNINRDILSQMFTSEAGLFDLFDLFSGGAFSNFTIFALSITPYITASIVVNLLSMAFPYFQRLAQEGTEGRKKMVQITRYMTVVLGLIQAVGLTIGLFRDAIVDDSVFSVIVIILVLTAGTAFLMWLGEQINDKGIGNGISLIIFAGIVARIPSGIRSLWTSLQDGAISVVTIIILVVVAVLVVAGVVMIQEGQRRIPVQYAKRVVGRKMYGGQSTHIPMKVNQSGVILSLIHIWKDGERRQRRDGDRQNRQGRRGRDDRSEAPKAVNPRVRKTPKAQPQAEAPVEAQVEAPATETVETEN